MTLNPLTLEEYFHLIVTKPLVKETNMFERTQMFFTQQIEKFNSLLTKPVTFINEVEEEEGSDYYIFEMYTSPWFDSEVNKKVEAKRSLVIGDQVGDKDPTWSSVLDRILDAMSEHYGYDIKSQVYYVVDCPVNDVYPDKQGRMLNAQVLDQLLLAFPEVYERDAVWGQTKNIFA